MKRNSGKTSRIKAELKKAGVAPVRVTVKETGARVWYFDGKHYQSIEEILALPEVQQVIKDAKGVAEIRR